MTRASVLTALLTLILAASAQAASEPTVIAYNDEQGNVFTIDANGAHGAVIYKIGNPRTGGAFGKAWSPNGHVIALAAGDTTGGLGNAIILVDRSGHVVQRVLRNAYASGSITWSPDARQIAFECQTPVRDAPQNLCVVDVETGKFRTLMTSGPDLYIPYLGSRISWSPRGDVIAVGVSHDIPCDPPIAPNIKCSKSDIGMVDVATGKLTQLTNDGSGDAAFSPSGGELVFRDNDGIKTMSAQGTKRHLVVRNDQAGGINPGWSPDGERIVFSSRINGNNGNFDLFTVSAEGGKITQLTNDPDDDFGPDWAPPDTTCTVPKLKGKTLADAKKLIKRAGCVLGKVKGPKKNRSTRHVVKQTPRAHLNVDGGTKVDVTLG